MKDILVNIAAVLEKEYQDKYVDEEFLRWIFDEVVEFLDIREFVCNGFKFGGPAPMIFAGGGYDSQNKCINFFDLSLPLAKNEVHNDIGITDEKRKIMATNILMINTLLHEIEHAHQKKKLLSDSYEGYLLGLEDGNQETISTYDFMPSERFAENIANGQTKVILENMCVIMPDVEAYLEERRNHWLIKGYIDTYNQTVSYPMKMYMESHGKKFSDMSLEEVVLTYPELEDRLFYGLPISEEEYLLVRERAGLDNSKSIYSLW